MALPLPVVIQAEQWAQCDNPNCQKWRKLPASTTLNDDEPWYCYLNPDHNKNTCSASEVSYDEKTEFVLPEDWDAEEAAHNLAIKQRLATSIAAGTSRAKGKGSGKAKAKSGSGRGSGKKVAAEQGFSMRRDRSVSFAEDWEDEYTAGQEVARGPSRKQCAKHFQRLLCNQGSWEPARASGAAQPVPPPADVWEGLEQHVPELAAAACAAADLSSCIRYFPESTEQGRALAAEASDVARLAAMLASAAGAAATQDALPAEERRKLGLGAG